MPPQLSGVAAIGPCASRSLVAAGVRGSCTVLVTRSGCGVEASCQSWRIRSSTRELPQVSEVLKAVKGDFVLFKTAQERKRSFHYV